MSTRRRLELISGASHDTAGSSHDAAINTQSGVAAADDALHGSPTSYAAAAKTHLPAAAPQAAGGTAPHRAATASPQWRWRWTDVRELVVYGLGSFESGGRLHSFHGRQSADVVWDVTRVMGRSCTLSLLSSPRQFHMDVRVVATAWCCTRCRPGAEVPAGADAAAG